MTGALHAAWRGTVGALAMSGLRMIYKDLGIVDHTPPAAIAKRSKALRRFPRKRRRTIVEALHCAVGAVGGIQYGLLPESVRRQPWSGPVWGIAIWIAFDNAVGPLLGVKKGDWPKPRERAALITDHILYGLVLSETRQQPRE